MSRRLVVHLATATAVVTAGVLAGAAPASADLVTYCIGTGGAVTVPNDLYVPPNESCALTGTIITGNVSVAAGANLVVTGGRVSGNVQVASNGYLDASNSSVSPSGGTWSACAVNSSGVGNALRSTLPFAVSGRLSSTISAEGTM